MQNSQESIEECFFFFFCSCDENMLYQHLCDLTSVTSFCKQTA